MDEVRDSGEAGEIQRMGERQLAPLGAPIYNPVFGATPLELVAAITPERGIYRPSEMPTVELSGDESRD